MCSEVFFNDFQIEGRRLLVVGMLKSRDARELLGALRADEFDEVVCCTAPTPRGTPASEVAAAARAVGCEEVKSGIFTNSLSASGFDHLPLRYLDI